MDGSLCFRGALLFDKYHKKGLLLELTHLPSIFKRSRLLETGRAPFLNEVTLAYNFGFRQVEEPEEVTPELLDLAKLFLSLKTNGTGVKELQKLLHCVDADI